MGASEKGAALVHRKSLIGFRAASAQLWGEAGMSAISRELPADVRDRTAGILPLPDWIPLEDLIAWHMAVWNGPAKREEVLMTRHARLTVDHGFGRVKRLLIGALTPRALAARVATLWRDEYSTGRLEIRALNERSVQLALTDHAYVEIPLMRMIIAEVYRYVLSMTRAKNVTVSHFVRDGALLVNLRWD